MKLRYRSTVCPFCPTGCSFNVPIHDGVVVASGPYHRAYEMISGNEWIYSPLIRKDGELEATVKVMNSISPR